MTTALLGAELGAEAGALGGPLGAAVGAVAGALLGLAAGYGATVLMSRMKEADKEAEETLDDAITDQSCETCPCARTVVISRSTAPQAAQHIVDAQAKGYPSVLTLDKEGTEARRYQALKGIPTVDGMDRDEYPPAVFLEGGAGASVRHIPLSDNRSAGAQMRNQLRGASEGCKITIAVGP